MVKFAKDFTAGGWAAVVAKTIIAPVERVKLILQLQNAQSTIEVSKRYRGMVDCFVRVPREQGFLSFWRGNWSNILRASSQESLGMAFKEIFKKYLVTKDSDYTKFVAGNFMAGGLSGCATFCFIYPLDFSRTRLAIDMGKDASSREFNGLMDCLMKIGKHDGFFGLYRGFLPSLQYIFLYRATYYGLFDTLKVVAVDAGLAKHNDLSFSLAFAIAQYTAIMAAMLSYPLDTVRRRLMMQAGKKVHAYNGTLDCAKKIYRAEGWRSFYNGAFVNAIRGVGAALVLALYNEMSKHF
ncbi:unnamed protein product [Bursaphelenchus xylophilus]|uniref:ADP/ATP translocase n=1 Tax=Bursaphelenchus xylophilus TaxID=6326 RepID=A0A1I7SMM1_BURXY|nr:unnamed protein product [Bursaphelenchus xylophilus]CAG9130282.1 unnamed protein product [Bursaphelenchus xylophilus]